MAAKLLGAGLDAVVVDEVEGGSLPSTPSRASWSPFRHPKRRRRAVLVELTT
ncbi:MAG: hypothetical protein R2697_11460 [Ilumatobacteraceae bacterium]